MSILGFGFNVALQFTVWLQNLVSACVIVCVVFATFQGYPGEDNKTPGPAGPLGEPVGLAFL